MGKINKKTIIFMDNFLGLNNNTANKQNTQIGSICQKRDGDYHYYCKEMQKFNFTIHCPQMATEVGHE